jgi:hypothetical protein
MGRRITRDRRPLVECCERRQLLSAITTVMAVNSLTPHGSRTAGPSQALAVTASQTRGNLGFVPSNTSIALAQNQGPPPVGTNLALTPTGTLTPHELRRQRFVARYTGTYTIGPGRTSTEALQTFITATGTANTMLHSDIQLRIITPKDRGTSIGGVCGIFDRNLNSNTGLGFDVLAPQQDVDSAGRPNRFPSMTTDVNMSAGTYVDSYAQGVMNIRYIPSGKRTPGVLDQGKAIVTIHAQIYAANANFILRNANIDP